LCSGPCSLIEADEVSFDRKLVFSYVKCRNRMKFTEDGFVKRSVFTFDAGFKNTFLPRLKQQLMSKHISMSSDDFTEFLFY
jgi:hypothetical protein